MTARQVRALMEARESGWVARGLVGPTSDELRSLGRDAGWRFVEVLLADVHDKAELMATLSSSFELPACFGGNWDAFEECLGDQLEQEPGMLLRLKGLGGLPDELSEPLVEIVADYVSDGSTGSGDAAARPGEGVRRRTAPLIVVADPPLPVGS